MYLEKKIKHHKTKVCVKGNIICLYNSLENECQKFENLVCVKHKSS